MAWNRSASTTKRLRPTGRWLPVAAISFVLLSLVALALTPTLVLDWFEAARREAEVGALPARTQAVRLALATERQVAATGGYLLSGDPIHRTRFQQARAVQLEALERLGDFAPRIGPTAFHYIESIRYLASRWHEEHARALDGRITAEEYVEAMPRLGAMRDSILVHVAALEDEIARAGEAQLEEAERALGLQRSISIGLGALAFLAALVVGWFARRQWYLTGAVEQALAEENRLREETERAHEELVLVTESRARLMRGFGHDVKNPLGAADGYLQLLTDGILGTLTEQQLRAVQRASRSIGAAINLVEDLVDLARAETGRLEMARVSTDLREVAQEAADEYRAQAEAKRLALRLEVPEHFPLVETDGRRVRQVLGNLVSNAVKYTHEGVVTIRLRLTQADPDSRRARCVAIEVADTGPGIPPEQQHLLFQEFTRLAPAAAQGAGLGLTISKRLAEALGGEVTLESEVGRGSTFTLMLPLRRSTDLHAA